MASELTGDSPEAGDLDPTTLLSTHPADVHALMHDPLCLQGGFHPATVWAVQAAWPEVAAALPQATLRIFPDDLHEHDRVVVHEELIAFVDQLALATQSVARPNRHTGGAGHRAGQALLPHRR